MGFFYTSVCVCFQCFSYPTPFVEDGLFGCREPVGTGDHCLGFLDPVHGFRDGHLVWRVHCGTSPAFWRQFGFHLSHWFHQCRDLPRSRSVVNVSKTFLSIRDWSNTLCIYMYRSNVKGGFICNFCLNLRVFRFKPFKGKPLQTFEVKSNPALIILLLMAHLSMCRSPGQHPDEEDVVPPSLFPGGRTQHLWPHCPALHHEHDLPSLLLWHCHRSVMNGVWSKNFNSETEVNSGTLN